MTHGNPTPGPWKMYKTSYAIGVAGSKGSDVAIVKDNYAHPLDSRRSEAEDVANACLLAAAPDLLAALKHARSQMQHPDQMIDEAIAKAEGRE